MPAAATVPTYAMWEATSPEHRKERPMSYDIKLTRERGRKPLWRSHDGCEANAAKRSESGIHRPWGRG